MFTCHKCDLNIVKHFFRCDHSVGILQGNVANVAGNRKPALFSPNSGLCWHQWIEHDSEKKGRKKKTSGNSTADFPDFPFHHLPPATDQRFVPQELQAAAQCRSHPGSRRPRPPADSGKPPPSPGVDPSTGDHRSTGVGAIDGNPGWGWFQRNTNDDFEDGLLFGFITFIFEDHNHRHNRS